MISILRRRFILGSMIAMLILLTSLLGGIGIVSIVNLEQSNEQFMSAILNEHTVQDTTPPIRSETSEPEIPNDPFPGENPMPNDNSRRMGFRIGYYLIELSPTDDIQAVIERGIWNENNDEAYALAEEAISSGKNSGHLASQYRYRFKDIENGRLLVLLDVSTEQRMIADTARTALALSLACLAAMFLILLPVSRRVVGSFARNAERQKEFITNAGHELKTPLAIILSNLDAMELIANENKWSRNIRAQANRLNDLVHRLLFMAKMDENSLKLKREKTDIAALVHMEADAYHEIMDEKHIRFSDDVPQHMEMNGLPEYLSQLLHVLMDNAVQYTPENGKIDLSLTRKHGRISLSIENTVEALPDCKPEELFERFYRGDSAHNQSGGHGVGLSAAKAICELHGGRIRAIYGDGLIRFTAELKA